MMRLEAQRLTLRIGDRTLCAGLSFAVGPGQTWAVVGRNGVGKSSLLHCLAGLRAPNNGAVLWNNAPLQTMPPRERARAIGLLAQDSDLLFPITVLETVLSGRHPHSTHWWQDAAGDYARARAALRQVDMDGFEGRVLGTLSGGERRRVEFAALLCQEPAVMLLDEPANHLDIRHQIELFERVRESTRSAARAAVIVTHDLNAAARYCDRCVLLMGDGTAATGPTREILTEQQLTRAFDFPIRRIDLDRTPLFVPGNRVARANAAS